MTDFVLTNPDGSTTTGAIHPEIAEPSYHVLMRDLKLMRRHRCSSFIRKPYEDLDEIENIKTMNAALAPSAKVPQEVLAIMVVRLVAGETNARIPLNKEQLEEQLTLQNALNLYDRPSGKGFA